MLILYTRHNHCLFTWNITQLFMWYIKSGNVMVSQSLINDIFYMQSLNYQEPTPVNIYEGHFLCL